MANRFVNPNLGKSPHDPDYDSSFDSEKEWQAYEQAQIEAAERKMEQ